MRRLTKGCNSSSPGGRRLPPALGSAPLLPAWRAQPEGGKGEKGRAGPAAPLGGSSPSRGAAAALSRPAPMLMP